MDWTAYAPLILWCTFVFILGLMVGSFLNVLIARLPYEKSIIWPSSRCFACFQPVRLTDNLPIIGYLRLRGKCRNCQAPFSSRYLWVEIGTGFGFLALFVVEILLNWNNIPALKFRIFAVDRVLPPWQCLVFFAYHAFLLSALIASAVIDAEHRIIPPLIPYAGLVVGVVGGTLLPWPWPNPADPAAMARAIANDRSWINTDLLGNIPLGLQPWPFWGPTFQFAPPGSIRMGFITAILGALAGSLVVRLIKWLFEVGFGREAMGLGDADLLMMAGAFLGWQIAVLSLFVGAVTALILKLLGMLLGLSSTKPAFDPRGEGSRELPFGPGLALGVIVTWFAWRWLGPRVQFVFFDAITIGLSASVMCIGMVAAGLLLRRPEETQTSQPP
jgi:leader peptidase (prepilin peptidase) / N-methyltransferase